LRHAAAGDIFEGVIHPTAIIHPQAKMDATVRVGPYAIIDEGVELGPDCEVGPGAYLTGQTMIGRGNRFFAGCVIGEAPQDLKYNGTPTRLRIGEGNVFREHVTVHRSTTPNGETWIGSNNYLMANAHVGHNSRVGNHVIIANGALLGGHADVADRAFISGNCLVHQFVRVGTLSMMQGGAAISRDLPPYAISLEVNLICGLNVVGMRRAGMTAEERLEIKKVYSAVFRSGKNLRAAVAEAREAFKSAGAVGFLDFVSSSKRGVCTDAGFRHSDAEE
jgi:UDP-N-acetylglucosamine acyltransferase